MGKLPVQSLGRYNHRRSITLIVSLVFQMLDFNSGSPLRQIMYYFNSILFWAHVFGRAMYFEIYNFIGLRPVLLSALLLELLVVTLVPLFFPSCMYDVRCMFRLCFQATHA